MKGIEKPFQSHLKPKREFNISQYWKIQGRCGFRCKVLGSSNVLFHLYCYHDSICANTIYSHRWFSHLCFQDRQWKETPSLLELVIETLTGQINWEWRQCGPWKGNWGLLLLQEVMDAGEGTCSKCQKIISCRSHIYFSIVLIGKTNKQTSEHALYEVCLLEQQKGGSLEYWPDSQTRKRSLLETITGDEKKQKLLEDKNVYSHWIPLDGKSGPSTLSGGSWIKERSW